MQDNGLFGPDSVTWRVHLEPVLWVGGFRALLLQSLHPRVMRGTFQNSALFDPRRAWSRFQRTVEFVGVRTFGTRAEVEAAGARVRRLHATLRGYDPDTGTTFRVDEPSLLLWVHCAEIDSYAEVATPGRDHRRRRDGAIPRGKRARGPRDRAAGRALVARGDARVHGSVRPELKLTDEAREAVGAPAHPAAERSTARRLVIPTIASLSIATLPRWARRMYGLPGLPTTDLSPPSRCEPCRSPPPCCPTGPAADRACTTAHS